MFVYFVVTMVIAALGTGALLTALRFWLPTMPMTSVLWPARLPSWTAYVGIPLTLVGLVVWTVGLSVKSARVTKWGAYLALSGAGGFLGGWVGGAATSYLLQFFTAWPPPAATLPPKK